MVRRQDFHSATTIRSERPPAGAREPARLRLLLAAKRKRAGSNATGAFIPQRCRVRRQGTPAGTEERLPGCYGWPETTTWWPASASAARPESPRGATKMTDVLVIGAGPAGALAALRAADLGACTVLVTSSTFGGMAANDGPVPVRTLAHAARLISEARQFGEYGIAVGEPVLDYPRLLARLRGSSAMCLRTLPCASRSALPESRSTERRRRPLRRPHTVVTRPGCIFRPTRSSSASAAQPDLSDPWLPFDAHPQQRARSDLGSSLDVGHRRRGYGSAGRIDLQCIRLPRPTFRGRPPNPSD